MPQGGGGTGLGVMVAGSVDVDGFEAGSAVGEAIEGVGVGNRNT